MPVSVGQNMLGRLAQSFATKTASHPLCSGMAARLAAAIILTSCNDHAHLGSEGKMPDIARVDRARLQQHNRVMPRVGALLDAWENTSNDEKSILRKDFPYLCSLIESLSKVVEGD